MHDMQIQRSDGFVVQTGDSDPEGQVHGFKPSGASQERIIPLEIAIKVQANERRAILTMNC